MRSGKLTDRIFGIVLVVVLVGAMLPLGTLGSHSQVEASLSTTDVGHTVKMGAEPRSTAWSPQRKLAATSDGNLHVVYHRKDGSGILQIYHAESSDEGVT